MLLKSPARTSSHLYMQNVDLNQDDGSGKLYTILPYYVSPKDWPRRGNAPSCLPRVSEMRNLIEGSGDTHRGVLNIGQDTCTGYPSSTYIYIYIYIYVLCCFTHTYSLPLAPSLSISLSLTLSLYIYIKIYKTHVTRQSYDDKNPDELTGCWVRWQDENPRGARTDWILWPEVEKICTPIGGQGAWRFIPKGATPRLSIIEQVSKP